jgi:hypothetical protein
MIEVKGSIIKARFDFAAAEGGPGLLKKLQDAPPPVGPAANALMISLQAFPLATEDAISRFIANLLNSDERIYLKMGAFSADQSRNLQKIVHGRKTDPHALLDGVPRQYPQYLKGYYGEIVYETAGEMGGRIIWQGHNETYLSHCLSSIGYIARLLENSGVTGAAGRNAECLVHGHARCVWEFTWTGVTHVRRPTEAFKAVKVDSR